MTAWILKTYKLVDPIADLTKPCGGAITAFGSVWVPSCDGQSLVRLDPKTWKVTGKVTTGVGSAQPALAATADSVWVLSDNKTTLSRVDPDQNLVVAEIRLPAGCNSLTFGETALWVTCPSDNRLLRINPQTNLVEKYIEVPAEPQSVAIGENSVWVYCRKEGKVERIDPKTNKSSKTIELGVPGVDGAIAIGLGSVWVTQEGFPLTRIDPQTEKVVQNSFGALAACVLDPGGGQLALAEQYQFEDALAHRPQTRHRNIGGIIMKNFMLPLLPVLITIVALPLVTRAQDTEAPKKAANRRPPKPGVSTPGVRREMSAITPDAVFPIEGTPDWQVLTEDAVWVANGPKNTVHRLDPKTNTVAAAVAVGKRPCSGLAYGFGSVWSPSCGDKNVARIDVKTNQVVATVAVGPAQSEGGIAASPDAIWLVTDPKGVLSRIDPSTNKVVAEVAITPNSAARDDLRRRRCIWGDHPGEEPADARGCQNQSGDRDHRGGAAAALSDRRRRLSVDAQPRRWHGVPRGCEDRQGAGDDSRRRARLGRRDCVWRRARMGHRISDSAIRDRPGHQPGDQTMVRRRRRFRTGGAWLCVALEFAGAERVALQPETAVTELTAVLALVLQDRILGAIPFVRSLGDLFLKGKIFAPENGGHLRRLHPVMVGYGPGELPE